MGPTRLGHCGVQQECLTKHRTCHLLGWCSAPVGGAHDVLVPRLLGRLLHHTGCDPMVEGEGARLCSAWRPSPPLLASWLRYWWLGALFCMHGHFEHCEIPMHTSSLAWERCATGMWQVRTGSAACACIDRAPSPTVLPSLAGPVVGPRCLRHAVWSGLVVLGRCSGAQPAQDPFRPVSSGAERASEKSKVPPHTLNSHRIHPPSRPPHLLLPFTCSQIPPRDYRLARARDDQLHSEGRVDGDRPV